MTSLRMVVQKFRPLVEKRGIVLVAFEDKFVSAAQAEAAPKIFGHAADQEIRMPPGVMQNPGKHGRRRGFSMRAGDDERIVARQKEFLERLRKRTIRNFAIEDRFDFRIAARQRIAEDNDVRRGIEIGGVESVRPANPQAVEQRRRGRINAGVRARHAMSAFGQHSGERRHGRAADSRKMKMHGPRHARTAGSRMSRRPSPVA